MASFVYLLCTVTSLVCCIMLLRHYRRSRLNLLYWNGIAFLCFTGANFLLYVDLILLPEVDLMLWRNLFTLGGILVVLGSLIFETKGGVR